MRIELLRTRLAIVSGTIAQPRVCRIAFVLPHVDRMSSSISLTAQ